MKVTTKRRLIVVGIFIMSLIAMIALASMKPPQPKRPSVNNAPLVETMTLEPQTVSFEVRSQGTVRPRINTALSAEISGQITYISENFVAGGLFQANEVLLQIDPTDYQVAVTQAKALARQRQIEYEGAKSLRKQGYRAESELASAEAALAAAKSSLVRAEKNLERTRISLPYRGMVREKVSDLGQYVNPGSRLAVTFAIDTAEVRLPLTDRDLAFLDIPVMQTLSGDAVFPEVTLSAQQKGQPTYWQAKIVRTEGVVDEASRVTYAVAEIIDPYQRNQTLIDTNATVLPIGTYVSALIEGVEMQNIIKVPRDVLRGANELLFVDDDNKLRIEGVNILRTDADYAYIDDVELTGRRISLTAIGSPINGMSLRTTDDPPATEEQAEETVIASEEAQ